MTEKCICPACGSKHNRRKNISDQPTELQQQNAIRDKNLIAFYLSGHTAVATGEKFQLTGERIRQILRKHNIAPKNYGNTNPKENRN